MLANRLAYVLKQYPDPLVAFYTADVITVAMREGRYRGVSLYSASECGGLQLLSDLRQLATEAGEITDESARAMFEAAPSAWAPSSQFYAVSLREYIEDNLGLGAHAGKKPKWYNDADVSVATKFDTLVVWVSRLVNGAIKTARRETGRSEALLSGRARKCFGVYPTRGDELAAQAVIALERDLPGIADWWQSRPGVDINRLTFTQARYRARRWHAAMEREQRAGAIVPAKVVMRYSDGWTVQRLGEVDQFKAESEAMGHCVGRSCESPHSYYQRSQRGEIAIYSIRDERGLPHWTIEVVLDEHGGHDAVAQVQGRGNSAPKSKKNKERVARFIARLGLPGRELYRRGDTLLDVREYLNARERKQPWPGEDDVVVEGAGLRGANASWLKPVW